MVLTEIQKLVMRCIAANRSEASYMAGGAVLNRNLDVFQDADEQVNDAAEADIAALRAVGFQVSVEVRVYGCVEARVSRSGVETLIQWMAESRRRFFPLMRDPDWGARLHQADLAVNKVIAASTRTQARDFADLVALSRYWSPLGPLVLAAAGKPPHFSPKKTLDAIRHRGLTVANESFAAISGIPTEWTPAWIRDQLAAALDHAEFYLGAVDSALVGVLAVDRLGIPVEVSGILPTDGTVVLRRATDEPEIMPLPADDAVGNWLATDDQGRSE